MNTHWLVGISLLAFFSAPAETNTVSYRAAATFQDGSRLVGELAGESLAVSAEGVGELKLPLSRIRAIDLPGGPTPGAVTLANGDNLKGRLAESNLVLRTSLGTITCPASLIRGLKFYPVDTNLHLTDGLVALWSGEGDGRDTAGKHHGEVRAGVGFVPGQAGRAFSFGAPRSSILVPDAPEFKFTNAFTVAGWITLPRGRGSNNTQGPEDVIFMRADDRLLFSSYFLSHWGNSLRFGVRSGSGASDQVAATVPAGRWFYLVAVCDRPAGQLRLYIDGRESAKTENLNRSMDDLMQSPDPHLAIGSAPGTAQDFPFHGEVDELSLYSRVLAPEEIQALYLMGEAGQRLLDP